MKMFICLSDEWRLKLTDKNEIIFLKFYGIKLLCLNFKEKKLELFQI